MDAPEVHTSWSNCATHEPERWNAARYGADRDDADWCRVSSTSVLPSASSYVHCRYEHSGSSSDSGRSYTAAVRNVAPLYAKCPSAQASPLTLHRGKPGTASVNACELSARGTANAPRHDAGGQVVSVM